MRDYFGANTVRFVAQHDGRYLSISHVSDYLNGHTHASWRSVLRELVSIAVPAKLTEKASICEGSPGGVYYSFPLTYPLSVRSMAAIMSQPVEQVRAELDDMAVPVLADA